MGASIGGGGASSGSSFNLGYVYVENTIHTGTTQSKIFIQTAGNFGYKPSSKWGYDLSGFFIGQGSSFVNNSSILNNIRRGTPDNDLGPYFPGNTGNFKYNFVTDAYDDGVVFGQGGVNGQLYADTDHDTFLYLPIKIGTKKDEANAKRVYVCTGQSVVRPVLRYKLVGGKIPTAWETPINFYNAIMLDRANGRTDSVGKLVGGCGRTRTIVGLVLQGAGGGGGGSAEWRGGGGGGGGGGGLLVGVASLFGLCNCTKVNFIAGSKGAPGAGFANGSAGGDSKLVISRPPMYGMPQATIISGRGGKGGGHGESRTYTQQQPNPSYGGVSISEGGSDRFYELYRDNGGNGGAWTDDNNPGLVHGHGVSASTIKRNSQTVLYSLSGGITTGYNYSDFYNYSRFDNSFPAYTTAVNGGVSTGDGNYGMGGGGGASHYGKPGHGAKEDGPNKTAGGYGAGGGGGNARYRCSYGGGPGSPGFAAIFY